MYNVYLLVLGWAYAFFSIADLMTYVPTILKLVKVDADARSYSLVTWSCWVVSYLTAALLIYESGQRRIEMVAVVPALNGLSCAVISILILRLKLRAKGSRRVQDGSAKAH